MNKNKQLCKLVKDKQIDKKIEKYISKVDNPKYLCLSCGRVANKKSKVCKSHKI